MRRGFLWIWGLGTLLIAGLSAAAGYAAGVATHVTEVAAPAGGPYGPGRSHIEDRLEEWHKKAHGETTAQTPEKPS